MKASHMGAARHGCVRRMGASCVLLLALACSVAPAGPSQPDRGGDGASDDGAIPVGPDGAEPVRNVLAAPPSEATRQMAETYVTLCSACHGDWGEGSSAPSLWRLDDREALVRTIGARMPPKDPSLCAGDCAEQMADFILGEFGDEALSCAGIRPAPRQLRLLNRREYANTVRTLFGAALDGQPAQACGSYRFRFDPGREVGSVHVAGTFNGWSDGAWPMTYDASAGAWLLDRELADGSYELKYVVRDASGVTWHADPALPATGSFGNSVLTMSCASTDRALDLSSLPAETRPAAFPFDTTVASVVGTQQFEGYFATAKELAFALAQPLALSDCDLAADRAGCGRQFLSSFGKRVFRRPLREAELSRYLALLESGDDVELALRTTLTALLASPGFLYRSELGVPQADGSYLLTPHEVASALSYLFVADMPDAMLMAAADAGGLRSEADLEKHARRLLGSARSRGALSDFVLQWLGVSSVTALSREATATLLPALREETHRFAEHVLFDATGTLAELLTADYSFVDAELAALYGMPTPAGQGFHQADYADGLRSGVLGHGSVLATYAHAEQASPVLRGLFVRRQLLCQRFGDPPPNAGTVPEPDPSLSTRERFDMHSTDACASCHEHIDALGFGFEHFDMLGKYREQEGAHPVDAAGELTGVAKLSGTDRQPFGSPRELAPLLVQSAAAHDCVAKQSYRFARGALDGGLSYCAVKLVRQRYRESRGRVLEALLAAVEAVDFRYRY
jgi:cytochrome c553